MPAELSAGILYVSERYKTAIHLCPCGCNSKIVTPLEPTEWTFVADDEKPTLYPSLGNWQLPCRSHYWIFDGKIEWSFQWSEKQIEAGRRIEERRTKRYFDDIEKKNRKKRVIGKIVNWLLNRRIDCGP